MRWIARGMGLLLALAGAIWMAQGLNLPFAPHSFMTADRSWILIGLVTLLAGGGAAAWGWRRT